MLNDYRVLDLTDGSGIFCGYILAHLGAEVVALEPPGGRPERQEQKLLWQCYARGRASLEIDISACLLYTSPSPRDRQKSRMPSSA